MSEYYQENYDDNNYQAPKKNNDNAVFMALLAFLLIAFILGGVLVGGSYFLYKYGDGDKPKNNTVARILNKRIERISPSNVSEYKGNVEFRTNGSWAQLNVNKNFEEDASFKTSENSYVTIQMHNDNQVKVYSSSECSVKYPELDDLKEKVAKQIIKLTNGEITAVSSITGKGLINIEVSDITIVAQSGLFKVIYNEKEDKGEVVVKNGLVEVKENGSTSKPIKLSGFYKVTFEKGRLSSPVQASVILYNWR